MAKHRRRSDDGPRRNPLEPFDQPPPTYDPETDTYRLQPETDGRISTLTIAAVAYVEGVDPLEMEPAYDGNNLDALDGVAAIGADESVGVSGEVTVTIAGRRVTLEPDGELVVAGSRDDEPSPR